MIHICRIDIPILCISSSQRPGSASGIHFKKRSHKVKKYVACRSAHNHTFLCIIIDDSFIQTNLQEASNPIGHPMA